METQVGKSIRERVLPHLLRAAGVAEVVIVLAVVATAAVFAIRSDGSEELAVSTPGPALTSYFRDSAEVSGSSTIYIVEDERQGAALRRSLEEGNNVRFFLGLPPLREEVIVVPDAEAAARALHEGNLILAAFQVDVRIVTLAG